MRALVSIHDVMPETLERVARLLDYLPRSVRRGTLLLVVPGRDWRPEQVAQLARWQAQGLELAGHGWSHRAVHTRTWYHRCHAYWVSRHAAEHLSQSAEALRALLARNYRWFVHQGLTPPALYVPPAWALGALAAEDLAESPFQYLETTSGIRHLASGRRRRLPLIGFEADTPGRALMLAGWNRANRLLAGRDRPLRLAIHPYDDELYLAGDLRRHLARLTASLDYRMFFHATRAPVTER